MGGGYTLLRDCDETFDCMSYQVGLERLGDSSGDPAGHRGFRWNVYGGEWHLMSGEADYRLDAQNAAVDYIRREADEAMSFLLSSGGR